VRAAGAELPQFQNGTLKGKKDSMKKVSGTKVTSKIHFIAAIMLFACVSLQAQVTTVVRTRGAENRTQAVQSNAVVTGNGIDYHGGPVMLGPHNVY
jgi:hypothetical protein